MVTEKKDTTMEECPTLSIKTTLNKNNSSCIQHIHARQKTGKVSKTYLVTAEGNIYPDFHGTPLKVCMTSILVSIFLQLSHGKII